MTNLQQRKDAIAKEMREIEILERLENERNSESEKIKWISRLLLNLHDQPLACGLPIGTVAHVKMIFDASCETCTTCYFADTCEEIVSLTSKSKRKKSSGTRKSSKDNIPILKDFSNASKGIFEFRFKELSFGIVYTDFVSFKKELARILPRKKAIELGMKTGQYSGLMHFNGMRKNLKL